MGYKQLLALCESTYAERRFGKILFFEKFGDTRHIFKYSKYLDLQIQEKDNKQCMILGTYALGITNSFDNIDELYEWYKEERSPDLISR